MIEETLLEAEAKMDQAVGHLQTQFATVRTGRANPALLHRVMVDYYGSPTLCSSSASFSVPEPACCWSIPTTARPSGSSSGPFWLPTSASTPATTAR